MPDPLLPASRRPGFDGRRLREIMCRSCALWCHLDPDDGLWHHPDGTPACVQPQDLYDVADAIAAEQAPGLCYHREHCGATATNPCSAPRQRRVAKPS